MSKPLTCDRCGKPCGFAMHAVLEDGARRHLECFTEEETFKDNGGWRNRPVIGPKPPPACECPYEGKAERWCPVHPELRDDEDDDDPDEE